ncbi:DUF4258 domain-containing protein, partial [Candidatus Poribacteria bacterium]|nr:DUF4258 domain-containing protein [Candidatus Poribacteria bacterium]
RRVEKNEVRAVINTGQIIAEYPNDNPFPSCLMLATVRGRPLHVVVAVANKNRRCHIVTIYVPDPAKWSDDFKTRRRPWNV